MGDTIREIVARNCSRRAVVRDMLASGYKPPMASLRYVQREVERLGLSTDHWTGKAHGTSNLLPLDPMLVAGGGTHQSVVKKKLLQRGDLKNHCILCGMTNWCGKPIVMHMDHINGDDEDHSLGNLRMVCPNCHSTTPTYKTPRRGVLDLTWRSTYPSRESVFRQGEPGSGRRSRLRMYALASGWFPYICTICKGPPTWRGQDMDLVLDHANGILSDSRPENLRFLCPNCHAQTPTFAGKNIRRRIPLDTTPPTV